MNEKIYVVAIPNLMEEWDWDKNNQIGLDPNKLLLGSNKRAWWKCKNDHEYIEMIGRKTKGKPCPYCANKRVIKGFNDLTTLYPDLAKEWDFNINKNIDIDNVVRGSNKQVWWKCSTCGHSWSAKVSSRTKRGSGCPECAMKKRVVSRSKNLLDSKGGLNVPLLLKEWDYEENGDLYPSQVTNGSQKTVH